jgi:hypothetical protein
MAVQNAILEPWSNGQTEGQINRLKTPAKRAFGLGAAFIQDVIDTTLPVRACWINAIEQMRRSRA